jgi:hypothetical protein
MFESRPQNSHKNGTGETEGCERRNRAERRLKPSSGFTCISTVGWICRREKIRRKNDPDTFVDPECK